MTVEERTIVAAILPAVMKVAFYLNFTTPANLQISGYKIIYPVSNRKNTLCVGSLINGKGNSSSCLNV